MQSHKHEIDHNRQVLHRFRAGDRVAYEELYKKYYPALCFFLQKMGLDLFPAEEIVQDVLHTAWKRREDFAEITALRNFLYISSKNAGLNQLDKNKRAQVRARMLLEEAGSETVLPTSYEMMYAETLREIHDAIQTLPEQCAKVMSLIYQEGMSPKEVAEQLQLSPSTVYTQRQRGLEALRQVLTRDQYWLLLYVLELAAR